VAEISLRHQNDLSHHIAQGRAWLAESAEGENTAALSYAAFELRFGIERLAIHYWTSLLNRNLEMDDLKGIGSFKTIERRIYDLAGHQKEIDGHFEFMRVVLGALKIDGSFLTPKIGRLSSHWHDCSELCHTGWTLACAVSEVRKATFTSLAEIAHELSAQVVSMGWPILQDAAFADLRNQFVHGNATTQDVLTHIQHSGLWARANFPDGRTSQFIGEPIAPTR